MVELRLYGFQGAPPYLLAGLVKELSKGMANIFSPVSMHGEPLPVPQKAYVPARGQYLAHPFLEVLAHHVPSGTHGLALVDLDLFVPRLNFIFGLAQIGGHALVALPRLRQSFYGLPNNPSLYFQRVIKEALHELGHVLGLHHCNHHCVMRFSNTLHDTDRKPAAYCPSCLARLQAR